MKRKLRPSIPYRRSASETHITSLEAVQTDIYFNRKGRSITSSLHDDMLHYSREEFLE